jgi:AraC-like DNA-binding protein
MHRSSTVPQREAATDTVAPPDRVAYWEAHNASELIGLQCTSYAAGGLRAHEHNFDLGALRLADVAGNEHVIQRTPDAVRRYPKDSVFAAVVLEGQVFFYQQGRWLTAGAGDVLLYSTSKPYLCGFPSPARQLLVDLPASSLMQDEPWLRLDGPMKIEGTHAEGRSISAELAGTLRGFAARPLTDDAPRVIERVRGLCRALLTFRHDLKRTGASPDVRRLRAVGFIADHLGESELDASAVARHVCISLRHLNRLFAHDDGCTVTQWIWHARLQRAHRLLTEPAWRGESVGEVAARCGFASSAHFAGAFKARFGLTPSQHRRQASTRPMATR